jgi:hypothetical protein
MRTSRAELAWRIVFYGPVTAAAVLLRVAGVDVMRLRRPRARRVSLWVDRRGRRSDMQSQR